MVYWIKKIFTSLSILIIAAICAEFYLRGTVPREIWFDQSYSLGVHTPDKDYGFVFTPNFKGVMRSSRGVYAAPFELDENGLRPPARSSPNHEGKKIAIVGGRSVMFGYGVVDSQTVYSYAARNTRQNCTIYPICWPGFPPVQSFYLYKKFIEPKIAPDIALLCLYPYDEYGNTEFTNDFYDQQPPPLGSEIVKFKLPGLVFPYRYKPITDSLGPYAFKSYVGYSLLNTADRIQARFVKPPADKNSDGELATSLDPKSPVGAQRMARFIRYLNEYYQQRHIQFGVMFLLRKQAPNSFHRYLVSQIPKDIPVFDLNDELNYDIPPEHFIAGTHYDYFVSQLVGNKLAEHLDELMQKSK